MYFAFIFLMLHLALFNAQIVKQHDLSTDIKEPHFKCRMKGSERVWHIKFDKELTSSGEPCKDYEIKFTDLNGNQYTKHSKKNSIDIDYDEINNLTPQLEVNACGQVNFYDLHRLSFMVKGQPMESNELYEESQRSRDLSQKLDQQKESFNPLVQTQSRELSSKQPISQYGQSNPIVSPTEFQPEETSVNFEQEKPSSKMSQLHKPTAQKPDHGKSLEMKQHFQKEIDRPISQKSSKWQKPLMPTTEEQPSIKQPTEVSKPSFDKYKPLKIPGYQVPMSREIGLSEEVEGSENQQLPSFEKTQVSTTPSPSNLPRSQFKHKNIEQFEQSLEKGRQWNVQSDEQSKNVQIENIQRPKFEQQRRPTQMVEKEKPLNVPSFEKSEKNVMRPQVEKRDVEQQTKYETLPKQTFEQEKRLDVPSSRTENVLAPQFVQKDIQPLTVLDKEKELNVPSYKKSQTGIQENIEKQRGIMPESQMVMLSSEFGRPQFEQQLATESPFVDKETLWQVPNYEQIQSKTKENIEKQRLKEKSLSIPSHVVQQQPLVQHKELERQPLEQEVEQPLIEKPSQFKLEDTGIKESGIVAESQMLSKKAWKKPSVEKARFEQNVPQSSYEKEELLNIPSYKEQQQPLVKQRAVEQLPLQREIEQTLLEKPSESKFEDKDINESGIESGSQMYTKKTWEKPSVETSRYEYNAPQSIYEKQRPLNIQSYQRISDVEYEERRNTMPRIEQEIIEMRPSREQWTKPSYETSEFVYQPQVKSQRPFKGEMTYAENSWKTAEQQLKPITKRSYLEKPFLKEVAEQPSENFPKKQKNIYEEILIERRRVPMSATTPSTLAVGVGAPILQKQLIEQPVQPVSPIELAKPTQPVSTVQPEKIVEEEKFKEVKQPEWVESRTVSSATAHYSSNFLDIALFSTLFAFIVNKIF